jgi:hypothetical protein
MHKRGTNGKIMPFQNKFPSGMKALGDYIHSKGLKFGVYSDAGNNTCEGYPGSWGYEKLVGMDVTDCVAAPGSAASSCQDQQPAESCSVQRMQHQHGCS